MAKKFKNRFDRMFDGYQQQTFFDANGKRVTKMVYTGPRYVQQLEDRERLIYKILYIALFFIGIAMVIVSGIFRVPANFAAYVTSFEAVSIILGIFTAIYVFMYAGAEKGLDTYTYKRAHERLRLFSILATAACAITAICAIVAMIVAHDAGNFLSWLCAILQLLAGGCFFVIFYLENKTEYVITDSDIY